MGLSRAGLLPACLCLLLCSGVLVAAQDSNTQGGLLFSLGKWLSSNDAALLSSLGWADGSNPCTGSWQGVTCNAEGYVTAVNLANKGLKGSLPAETSIWGGLTGLTSLDLSGNSLGGTVPTQLSASGPQLTSINLSGNAAVCGQVPAGISAVDSTGTSVGKSCDSVAATTPPATAADVTPPAAADNTTAPAADTTAKPAAEPAALAPKANTTNNTTAAAPTQNTTAVAKEAPAAPVAEAPAKAPAPPPTVIANAPVCSCALRGFGSTDCSNALKNVCAGSKPPTVCDAGDPSSDEAAAEQLGQYLANTCFPGQDMHTNICNCVANLLGNDCAKARVNLCVSKDSLCLPFQNIIDVNGSTSADAVGKVATVLNDKCPVSEPTVPGVKATMEFPDLSMGQYITNQYTQNVANALSSVTNVPSTAISTLDVRPFIAGSKAGRRRSRTLLQSSGNGVQATYFLATNDPQAISDKLSAAGEDGSLSTKLSQYGITAQAGGLKVQSFLPAPPTSGSSSGSSGFPMWAVGVIVAAIVLLALAVLLWFCCFRRKKNRQAKEYAPETKLTSEKEVLPKAATYNNYDATPTSDALPKSTTYNDYNSTPTPVTATATVASVGAAAAAAATGAAAARGGVKAPTTPEDLPVSRSSKVADPEAVPMIESTRPSWDANSQGGASTHSSVRTPSRPAGTNLTPVKTSVAGSDMSHVSGPTGTAASADTTSAAGSAASGWRTNVRPASGQLPATAGATNSMANTAGKGSQQAERAKFWAQFQETWQQVRQNQNIHDADREPGTPSSGTNWTDITGQVSPKKH